MEARWDAEAYDRGQGHVSRLALELIGMLRPRDGERILDLGCGTGVLAGEIAASGASVVGIDNASSMIVQARRNHPDIDFVVADAVELTFLDEFDAVFSNAAIHWMERPDRVMASVWRALRPGGRFVTEFGGEDNCRGVVEGVLAARATHGYDSGPDVNRWYNPSADEFERLLRSVGFRVEFADYFERPTKLEGGAEALAEWLRIFGEGLLRGIRESDRAAVVAGAEDRLRPQFYRDGAWVIDHRRLRVKASKPA